MGLDLVNLFLNAKNSYTKLVIENLSTLHMLQLISNEKLD